MRRFIGKSTKVEKVVIFIFLKIDYDIISMKILEFNRLEVFSNFSSFKSFIDSRTAKPSIHILIIKLNCRVSFSVILAIFCFIEINYSNNGFIFNTIQY